MLDKEVEIKKAELTMAGQVVDSMTEDFKPEQFHDTYREQMEGLIEAKIAGGEAFYATGQRRNLVSRGRLPTCWPSWRPA